jgi:hypothetical protein
MRLGAPVSNPSNLLATIKTVSGKFVCDRKNQCRQLRFFGRGKLRRSALFIAAMSLKFSILFFGGAALAWIIHGAQAAPPKNRMIKRGLVL